MNVKAWNCVRFAGTVVLVVPKSAKHLFRVHDHPSNSTRGKWGLLLRWGSRSKIIREKPRRDPH